MSDHDSTLRKLLLSYVSLLAERHGCAPGDNFEFRLWDDLQEKRRTLVSPDEAKELISLVIRCDAWVVYSLETRMFELIDIEAWRIVLEHRDH